MTEKNLIKIFPISFSLHKNAQKAGNVKSTLAHTSGKKLSGIASVIT